MSRSMGFVIAIALLGCQSSRGGEPIGEEPVQSVSESLSQQAIVASLKKPWKPKWSKIDDEIIAPVWVGDFDKGQMFSPLWRGNSPAIEDYVPAPPDGDCSKLKCTVRIDWDKAKNDVAYHIKCKGLMYKPAIQRTENVNWWPNQFHDAPKDIQEGGYRLWTLFGKVNNVEVPVHFYYNPQTLKLIGSSFDFPTQPPGTIDLVLPTARIIPSLIFHPDKKGFAAHEWHTAYDHVTVEGGSYSYVAVGFPPHDLCQSLPLQPAASQLRPYASPWQPAAAGPSWAEVLEGGLTFDMTIDETLEPLPGGVAPYGYSGVAFISNSPFVQGGIPNGHSFSLLAAFTNSPPLHRPVPGGNGKNCQGFVYDPHVNVPRYCEMPPQ